MNTLSFGPIVFTASSSRLEPISDYGRSRSVTFKTINDQTKLPKVSLTRPEPFDVTVRVSLFRALGSDVDAQVKTVDDALLAAKPYILTVGAVRSETQCVLTSVTEDNAAFSANGTRTQTTLTLKFMQYKANKTSSTSSSSSKITETQTTVEATPDGKEVFKKLVEEGTASDLTVKILTFSETLEDSSTVNKYSSGGVVGKKLISEAAME